MASWGKKTSALSGWCNLAEESMCYHQHEVLRCSHSKSPIVQCYKVKVSLSLFSSSQLESCLMFTLTYGYYRSLQVSSFISDCHGTVFAKSKGLHKWRRDVKVYDFFLANCYLQELKQIPKQSHYTKHVYNTGNSFFLLSADVRQNTNDFRSI